MESKSQGIGFMSLLGLLFIGLKLAGYIDWSWWWVLLPLYWPAALGLLMLIVGWIGLRLTDAVEAIGRKVIR